MKNRKRHSPEQIVKKLRDADAMLAVGKSFGEVLQSLELSAATLSRWRSLSGETTLLWNGGLIPLLGIGLIVAGLIRPK